MYEPLRVFLQKLAYNLILGEHVARELNPTANQNFQQDPTQGYYEVLELSSAASIQQRLSQCIMNIIRKNLRGVADFVWMLVFSVDLLLPFTMQSLIIPIRQYLIPERAWQLHCVFRDISMGLM